MSALLDHLTNAQVHLSEAVRIAREVPAKPPDVVPVPSSPQGPVKLATGVSHEYATMYPGSSNHAAFLFQYPGGAFGLHYPDGRLFKMLPSVVHTSSQPRWSRKKPTVFRYLYLNELREFDVATDQSVTLRKFSTPPHAFPNINGLGESDTSEDDDHVVLCSGQRVIVYEISTDRVIADFIPPLTFNNLYLTSQNEAIVGFYNGGHKVWSNGKFRVLAPRLAHMDTSSDDKCEPIMVWPDSSTNPFSLVKIRIADGERTPLFKGLDSSLAVHISLPDHAKEVIVTTYDPLNPNSTKIFANEIIKVALDGSGAHSLGKHGSDVGAGKTPAEKYKLQPKASISPDGSRLVFDANGAVYGMAI